MEFLMGEVGAPDGQVLPLHCFSLDDEESVQNLNNKDDLHC